jgi:hypothetical protein
MIRMADYGDRIEAYDRLPRERGARRLGVAQRAERGDHWRGWRVAGANAVRVCATKADARRWLELFADRDLAEAGPEFFAAQLARLAEAIRDRNGAGVLAALEYIEREGDPSVAADLAAYLRDAGVVTVARASRQAPCAEREG